MTRRSAPAIAIGLILQLAFSVPSVAYTATTTAPSAGGCPQLNRFALSTTFPLNRRWSTSLPALASPAIITAATQGTAAQLDEIEQTISASFSTWSAVKGTVFNSSSYPGVVAPIERVGAANACTNDGDTNVDGLNTICFNESSAAFTTGVLAFTRTFTANAPGAVLGSSPPALYAGQILDSDTLFRNDGRATFATPAALATPAGDGAYDLESLLTHELGHWMGLGHSAVIRAMMFPYAPPPGQYLGTRPTPAVPDAPLSDDDRTGIRSLYPDPDDNLNVGSLSGQIQPANPFALATQPAVGPGSFVTGIVGAHVVAIDANSGSVIAGALSGWSCASATASPRWDGTFSIQRLPVGTSYNLYVEPLIGIAQPSDFGDILADPCTNSSPACSPPAAYTNFNMTMLGTTQ
jgi:hypothetical protein